MAIQGATRRSRVRAPRVLRRGRSPFLVRWVLAITVSMMLGGGLEYVVASNQLAERSLQESVRGFQAQVAVLEESLAARPEPPTQGSVVAEELFHLRRTYGTLHVGLFDADGRPVGADVGDRAQVDPARLAEVLSTGRPSVQAASETDETGPATRYVFLLPVRAPQGLLVLEVDQDEQILEDLVHDLRLRKALGLLCALLLAVPLSYLLGGRSLRRQQLASAREADTDALTGLMGRRPFRPFLESALRGEHDAVALALIDLDGFKQVNDTLGHSYGDRVLAGLATSLGVLRPTDMAFRLGGDEFAVALTGVDDEQAVEIVQRVRASFAEIVPGVTFSCGIASRPTGQVMALQELWERTDAALYEAKRRGRRQTVTFQTMSSRRTVSAEKLDAVTALLTPDSAVTVAFQPIWDLRRGVVLAHEALLRLPAGSVIDGPGEAFELAQRLGLAGALDARARQAVLTAVRACGWHGLLFLNIHPDALPGLDVDGLVQDIAAAGLEPADVVLEVTEQAGLDHPEPVRVLKQARQRGFRLALDDMGHSNAGLRALTHVQFDVIKLDRQVVARLGLDPASAATVAAATTFVRQTGGWVIAEGVEDLRMLDAVLHGAELTAGREPVVAGQGYLLGHPLSSPVALDHRSPALETQTRGAVR